MNKNCFIFLFFLLNQFIMLLGQGTAIVNWPDFRFKNYDTMRYSIENMQKFIAANNHLPEIKSESKFKTEGFELVGDYCSLLKRVEIMSLQIISLQFQIDKLNKK